MSAVRNFIRTTVVGGVLFVLPVVLVVVLLQHALRIAAKPAAKIATFFPAHQYAGVAVATLVGVALLVFVAFLAGLVARTPPGRRFAAWIESSLLGALPPYRMAKSVAEGLVQVEGSETVQPVLVPCDAGWQVGLVFERWGDWLAVFLPSAPTPMSGSVVYVHVATARPLHVPVSGVLAVQKRLGTGSAKLLEGVDLGAPAA